MSGPTLAPEELARVAEVMAAAGTTPSGALRCRLVAGGRSNLTFRLDDRAGGAWVLRTPPRAGRTPSAHDVAREHRVTSALGGTDVPVPPAVALCDDESVLGAPFAVAGFVEGRTVQSRADLDELPAALLPAVVAALADALARLHRVDHVAAGLERFGRPDGYAARQLRRWAGQWDIVGAAFPPAVAADLARLVAALEQRLPEQRAVGVVHGDYRIDNTLLRLDPTADPTGDSTGNSTAGPSVAAVVDWELSTIGDPVADVAMMAVYRHEALDLVLGEPTAWTAPCLPDEQGLAAAYEQAGGVPLVDWERHLALGYLKLAVIAAGIDHRYRAGATHGAGFDTAGQAVGPLLAAGLAVLG